MARHYEDTETRRRQVAEAALHTIAVQGVTRFTTRAVAERVGISDGTLFRHFGSKQDIILEAMSLLEAEMDAGLVDTGDAATDLEAFFRHRAAFVGATGSVGRLIFSDELVHLWRQKNVGYLMDRLGTLHTSGRLRSDLDVPGMSMLVQGTLLTFAMQAALGRGGSEQELEARIDHAWTTLHTALFAA